MAAKVGVGLLGLGTVGGGVASILQNPSERHPLVGELEPVSYTHLTLPTSFLV